MEHEIKRSTISDNTKHHSILESLYYAEADFFLFRLTEADPNERKM